jgi:DNA-binding NarL/FixJ family response regulator
VLGLIARGRSTKQIAAELTITPKTADSHIQHIYSKLGVSTRAAATVFAMHHGLLEQSSGELPM